MRYFWRVLEILGMDTKNVSTDYLELLLADGDIEQCQKPKLTEPSKASFSVVVQKLTSLVLSEENRPHVVLASSLSVAGVGLNFLAPFIFGQVVESLADQNISHEASLKMIMLMTAVYMLNQSVPIVRTRILAPVSSRVTHAMSDQVVKRFLEDTSLDTHINTKEADKNFYFMKCFSVAQMMSPLLTIIMPTLLEMSIATVGLSKKYGYSMGLNLAVLFILSIGYSAVSSPSIILAGDALREAGQKGWDRLTGSVKDYKAIHDAGKLAYTQNKIHEVLIEFAAIDVELKVKISNVDGGLVLMSRLCIAASLMLVDRSSLTRQQVIVLMTYLQQLISQLNSLGQAINQVLSAYPDLVLVMSMLSEPSELNDLYREVALDVHTGPPAIEFKDVSFSYYPQGLDVGDKVQLFDSLSFVIDGGESVAFFAPSGGGKSTIFNLLFRYYTLHSGQIRINDQNISLVGLAMLRDKIALVAQTPNLRGGTVRENIQFGAANPDEVFDNKIMHMAGKAGLSSFISTLSEGLNTDIGEGGKNLSGGQQQKVAILRSLMKDAPILLLDEVTSGLDAQSADDILKNLSSMNDVTMLMITHRISELRYCNAIIVLDKGRVVGQGSHDELLAECPLYASSWRQYNSGVEAVECPIESSDEKIKALCLT